ncbi:MAG: hypothetical protein AAB838_00515, partial [Patescibacteria group bacterium]
MIKYLYRKDFKPKFDLGLLTGINWPTQFFSDHHAIALHLKDKNPHTVTIVIDNLDWRVRNNKKYVVKTKYDLEPLYKKLLFEHFYKEFGDREANEMYGRWLKKYKDSDETIKIKELESRYRVMILKRFKDHKKLFGPRTEIKRERIYALPEPLNYIDYRNPYDNIFIWEENGKKFAGRGGSGGSGQREKNSKFIYGLLELNKTDPIPSYLFLYNDHNELLFGKKFTSLCVPDYDIGSNYQLSQVEDKQLRAGATFLR